MSLRNAGHQLTLLKGSQAFFDALIAAIDDSAHEVRLETYIFYPDAAVVKVVQALIRAAQRGVLVDLVFDGVGTPSVPLQWQQEFAQAGVQWAIFRPLGTLGLLSPRHWRRLHRKLCVVDGQLAFCGGINLLDDRVDLHHGALQHPRLDFAVRVSGPLVRLVHAAMVQFRRRLQVTWPVKAVDLTSDWEALQGAAQGSKLATLNAQAQFNGVQAELVLRDNVRHHVRIERAYRHALGLARKEVLLANAYFLPGRKMRNSLIHAAQRGVRVRLLLQGRYEYFMQFHATRALYDSLLAAGIEIYEYRPSFLHAKVAVIDGYWVTVGSSNIDPLSLLLAREANVVVQDAAFALALKQELEWSVSRDAVRVDPLIHSQRSWHQRLLDRLALLLMRSTLFLIGLRRY
jgi:cardiolipin synthase